MTTYEYLILTRDKGGRWCEQGVGGACSVDLEAVAGPLLDGGTTPLNAALLLNGYGRRGWEMVHGDGDGADEPRYIVLKRPAASPAAEAALRRGAALLKGAAVGTLAVGLARCFMGDGASESAAPEEKSYDETPPGDTHRSGRPAKAGRGW
jgi:hypothetical protein